MLPRLSGQKDPEKANIIMDVEAAEPLTVKDIPHVVRQEIRHPWFIRGPLLFYQYNGLQFFLYAYILVLLFLMHRDILKKNEAINDLINENNALENILNASGIEILEKTVRNRDLVYIDPPLEAFQPQSITPQNPVNVSFSDSKEIPIGKYVRFNAANYMDGARVGFSGSSVRGEKDFVVFERDELPPGKAWCTTEDLPILTIHLSQKTVPLAVSYQHTKWYYDQPLGAPKIYDVFGCKDYYCSQKFPLAVNCEYNLSDDKGDEQICNITHNLYDRELETIQIHFRENHGDMHETCAYLIRVYAEKRAPEFAPEPLRNPGYCNFVANNYYYHKFTYSMAEKSCQNLYSNQCCRECPECCRDCEIRDFNFNVITHWICMFILTIVIWIILATIFQGTRIGKLIPCSRGMAIQMK